MLTAEPVESADGPDVGSQGKRETPRVTHEISVCCDGENHEKAGPRGKTAG